MAETAFQEFILPGTYVRVLAEGLIGVGGISTGNIGIVGTASDGVDTTHLFSGHAEVVPAVGDYDPLTAGTLNLARALEVAYRNGAGDAFARAVPAGADDAAFSAAFAEVLKEDVNLLIAPELTTQRALSVLGPVLETAENEGKDVIAVVGADADSVADISAQVPENDRVILTAPAIRGFDAALARQQRDNGDAVDADVELPGGYTAAAVAGLLSTLAPQSSPTNKALPGVTRLAQRFSTGQLRSLLGDRVCVLEQRGSATVRVVRGITAEQENGPFTQITTRRIVDYAKAGVRAASDPFIGRLNNERVRKALRGAIDGFLTTMLVDEALTAYELEVSATRQDEINGRAVVNVVLQPTFSIDFIAVTLVLQ